MGRKSKKKKKVSKNKHNEQLVNKKVKRPLPSSLTAEKDHKRPKISLCMIVKNEERYLDNCLKSVKEVVDEIIIVDTGSEDGTVEIAKKYTDKVYSHPWKDSFSEARNHYLNYATGDWIFQIDADEELVQEDIPVLLKAIKDDDIDAIMVQVASRFHKGKSEAVHSSERIFRNNGVIHYEGRVHNRVVGITSAKVYPIRLIHYGYDLDKEKSKEKIERTVSLLKMDLKDDPGNPITYHYLSCSYLSQGMFQKALEASLTAIRLADSKDDNNLIYLWSRYNAAMCHYKLKELNKAEEMALSALEKFPRHIDSHFILILVYFDRKRWGLLIDHGNEYIDLIRLLRKSPMAFANLVTNSLNEEWNMHVLIGIAYFELGQSEKFRKAIEKAVACAPEPFVALRAAGIYLHKKNDMANARIYLERAHKLNPNDTTVNSLLERISREEPTISCCMIVKDEEAFLEQCLKSVKDYVDEIIIVDTGSTDGTVEIARRYTDKVYFHPWEDSFSKARNQALQYATCDWVFQIDADEELIDGSGEKLRQAVENAGRADAVFVNIISTYSNGKKEARHNFERLFKNNSVIHYEGIVHNRVTGASCTKTSKIELMHYGYNVEEKKAQEKFIRTAELLKRQIKEEPDNPMPHHYLGTSYLSRGINEQAAEESALAIDLADRQKDGRPLYIWTHYNASIAFFRLGNLEKARRYSLNAIEKFPEHLDSYYMLTMIAAEEKEWEDVLIFGEKYLKLLRHSEENPEQTGLIINNTMKEEPSIRLVMGHAFHARKDFEQMGGCYRKAYAVSDEKWQVWWNVGTFHLDRSGDLNLARRYLDLALEESPEEYDVWYMLAKMHNKTKSFNEERRCLKWLFEHGSEDVVILNRLATLCVDTGDLDHALEAIDRAKKAAPPNYQILCTLGMICKQRKQMEKAIQAYMQAVEVQSDGTEAWSSLGEISLALNRLDEARVFFERVLSLQPGFIKVLLHLCEIELKQNRIVEFINRCDLILKKLGLDRDKEISDFTDIVGILFEIAFALKDAPDLSAQVSGLLILLPIDYESIHGANLQLESKTLDKAEFMMEKLKEVRQVFKHA